MRHIAALTLAAALLAAPASAATYTFSFDGIGDNPGRVSGLIDGLSDSGLGQSASSVVITSVTGSAFDFSEVYGFNFAANGYSGPEFGNSFFFSQFSQQVFDVVGGQIVLAEFVGLYQAGDQFNPRVNTFRTFCFYSTGFLCPGYLTLDRLAGKIGVYSLDTRTPTVSFTRLPDQPSAVPLPATAGLLLSALALTGLFARPRKAS